MAINQELLERDGAYRRMHSLQFATSAGGMLA